MKRSSRLPSTTTINSSALPEIGTASDTVTAHAALVSDDMDAIRQNFHHIVPVDSMGGQLLVIEADIVLRRIKAFPPDHARSLTHSARGT